MLLQGKPGRATWRSPPTLNMVRNTPMNQQSRYRAGEVANNASPCTSSALKKTGNGIKRKITQANRSANLAARKSPGLGRTAWSNSSAHTKSLNPTANSVSSNRLVTHIASGHTLAVNNRQAPLPTWCPISGPSGWQSIRTMHQMSHIMYPAEKAIAASATPVEEPAPTPRMASSPSELRCSSSYRDAKAVIVACTHDVTRFATSPGFAPEMLHHALTFERQKKKRVWKKTIVAPVMIAFVLVSRARVADDIFMLR